MRFLRVLVARNSSILTFLAIALVRSIPIASAGRRDEVV